MILNIANCSCIMILICRLIQLAMRWFNTLVIVVSCCAITQTIGHVTEYPTMYYFGIL